MTWMTRPDDVGEMTNSPIIWIDPDATWVA